MGKGPRSPLDIGIHGDTCLGAFLTGLAHRLDPPGTDGVPGVHKDDHWLVDFFCKLHLERKALGVLSLPIGMVKEPQGTAVAYDKNPRRPNPLPSQSTDA